VSNQPEPPQQPFQGQPVITNHPFQISNSLILDIPNNQEPTLDIRRNHIHSNRNGDSHQRLINRNGDSNLILSSLSGGSHQHLINNNLILSSLSGGSHQHLINNNLILSSLSGGSHQHLINNNLILSSLSGGSHQFLIMSGNNHQILDSSNRCNRPQERIEADSGLFSV